MKFKKFTKMISLLTAAVCVLTLTPAETVLADETRSVYTNEVISPDAALTRPIAIMMPPMESVMQRYCMKSWKRAIFPGRWPLLMIGRDSLRSVISEAAVPIIFPRLRSGIRFSFTLAASYI